MYEHKQAFLYVQPDNFARDSAPVLYTFKGKYNDLRTNLEECGAGACDGAYKGTLLGWQRRLSPR
jgi:hypothetical protein